ncbi:MAG: hypothetical protein KBD00_02190 [Candidatus Peribacteraceae bacterium]|nr:hypothetical protein [Candidatus Peribacteraceae bacterium]
MSSNNSIVLWAKKNVQLTLSIGIALVLGSIGLYFGSIENQQAALVPSPVNDAVLIKIDDSGHGDKQVVTPGQQFEIFIAMGNKSKTKKLLKKWTLPDYKLGMNMPNAFTFGQAATRTPITATVAPNGTAVFIVRLVAPTTPGVYPINLRMVQEGIEWFGEAVPLTVTVAAPGNPLSNPFGGTTSGQTSSAPALMNAAQFVSLTLDKTHYTSGDPFTASLVVKNTGTSMWIAGDTNQMNLFAVSTVNDDASFALKNPYNNANRWPLPTNVAPGQTVTVTIQGVVPAQTVPSTIQSIPLRFDMVQQGVNHFGIDQKTKASFIATMLKVLAFGPDFMAFVNDTKWTIDRYNSMCDQASPYCSIALHGTILNATPQDITLGKSSLTLSGEFADHLKIDQIQFGMQSTSSAKVKAGATIRFIVYVYPTHNKLPKGPHSFVLNLNAGSLRIAQTVKMTVARPAIAPLCTQLDISPSTVKIGDTLSVIAHYENVGEEVVSTQTLDYPNIQAIYYDENFGERDVVKYSQNFVYPADIFAKQTPKGLAPGEKYDYTFTLPVTGSSLSFGADQPKVWTLWSVVDNTMWGCRANFTVVPN